MAQNPQQQEPGLEWGQVVARAWQDKVFKQRLLSDPKAVLAEAGLPIPPTLEVQVHEATPTHLHLVLPPPPQMRADEKLSDAELDQVSGGGHVANPATWASGGTCAYWLEGCTGEYRGG